MKLYEIQNEEAAYWIKKNIQGSASCDASGRWSADSADRVALGDSYIPAFVKFGEVDSFTARVYQADQLPIISKYISSTIYSGTFIPEKATILHLGLKKDTAIDLSKITETIESVSSRFESVADILSSKFKHIEYLYITCSSTFAISMNHLQISEVKHVEILDSFVTNIHKTTNQVLYVGCDLLTDNILEVASPKVSPECLFNNNWHEVAKHYYGTGDTLGLQDALLDAGML